VYSGQDLPCTGVVTNTNLTELINQIDEFICNALSEVNTINLINVGEGEQIYKGISLTGKREIRSLVSSDDSVEITTNGNVIDFKVINSSPEPLIYTSQNVGNGVGVFKDENPDETFNFKTLESTDSSVQILTSGADKINFQIRHFNSVDTLPVSPLLNTVYRFQNREVFWTGSAWQLVNPRVCQFHQLPRVSIGSTNSTDLNYFSNVNTGTAKTYTVNLGTDTPAGVLAISADPMTQGTLRGAIFTRIVENCFLETLTMTRFFGGSEKILVCKSTQVNGSGLILVGEYIIETSTVTINHSLNANDIIYLFLARATASEASPGVYAQDVIESIVMNFRERL
jgi:hypothetical protein